MRIELKVAGESLGRFDVPALPKPGDVVSCHGERCVVEVITHDLTAGRVAVECAKIEQP